MKSKRWIKVQSDLGSTRAQMLNCYYNSASSDIPSLADTVKGPVWDDDTPQDFPEPTARQSTPPLTETETVQATDLVDPSINTGIVPENTESLSDITPHVESNSFDEATSGTKVHESLEVPNESNERTRDISVETTGQEMHYTVSEVMTDDVARSTAPLEDRDMDIVSVADDQSGEVIPYIIEEPVTEGRLTEVRLTISRREFCSYRYLFAAGTIRPRRHQGIKCRHHNRICWSG